MDLWTRVEQARSRWNVLDHPFYRRWSEGELTRRELACYSGQYRHAVSALARASASAAQAAEPPIRAQLDDHAAEEAAHVSLWDGFIGAVGGDPQAAPEAETAACARAWACEDRTLLGDLVALYAIESGQPAIAETKRDGLREHYGIDSAQGTAYFDLHAERDHEHAAASRALIEARVTEADVDALVAEAEAVLRANWELLDGVERSASRP